MAKHQGWLGPWLTYTYTHTHDKKDRPKHHNLVKIKAILKPSGEKLRFYNGYLVVHNYMMHRSFLKEYISETIIDKNCFTLYRRIDTERNVTRNNVQLDN